MFEPPPIDGGAAEIIHELVYTCFAISKQYTLLNKIEVLLEIKSSRINARLAHVENFKRYIQFN